jgi:hypothetical protein
VGTIYGIRSTPMQILILSFTVLLLRLRNESMNVSSGPSSSALIPERTIIDAVHYSLDEVTQPGHAIHAHCPDTLNCLPDTDGRPQHTLPVILRCAILGSPRKRLTIREIYSAMEDKYLYYKTAGPTWKVRPVCCMGSSC